MKKKIIFYITLGIIAILIVLGGRYLSRYLLKQNQEPISIIIASDIHYLSPDYRGTYFKEPASYFDGKLTHYSPEYFDAFLGEVLEKQPQVLILSGDITLNGSQKSHEEVIEKLNKIEEAGITVLVIPGNHDVDTTAGDYSGDEPVAMYSASTDDFRSLYQTFGPDMAISQDSSTFSYVYEATPYLRILMLDTNSNRQKGFISDDTLIWIEEQLKDAKNAGADVIAVSHQNLHIHNELLYFSYQLYDADELFALYEEYDVTVNLSGHIHVQSIVSDSEVPEIAVGSLAIGGTPYGQITYDGKNFQYTTELTDVSAYAMEKGYTDENLLDFNNYSTYYFEEVGRLQVLSGYEESELPEEDILLLADTFAKINASYFLGANVDAENLSEGIALWRTQEDAFIIKYVETMLSESQSNNQTITLPMK